MPSNWRKGERINQKHNEIRILIFGGSKFKDREPNFQEFNDRTFVLTIPPQGDNFHLKYLPGAKLRCEDKFFGNMHTKIDANKNTVTIFGSNAAHRINTGRKNLAHLKWKFTKEKGYGALRDALNWTTHPPPRRPLGFRPPHYGRAPAPFGGPQAPNIQLQQPPSLLQR